ncbi:MAG: tetratricopeptide repeat protein [Pirellulales bacterium]|nr:tetratricopeptide repeat protein [Pirellulales bacterium]
MNHTWQSPLDEAQALYDRGLYVQAWRCGLALGPLNEWPGTAGRILAGRVAHNLGAMRLGAWLHFTAWRADPNNVEARLFYTHTLRERRGTFTAWQFTLRPFDREGAAPRTLAFWHACEAALAADRRDFEAAHAFYAQAKELASEEPWIGVDYAWILRCEDRLPEALVSIEALVERHPFYRPAISYAAELLQASGRDFEARALLEDKIPRLESVQLSLQLIDLLTELDDYDSASLHLERLFDEHPILESSLYQSLTCRRSDIACALGDIARAARYARQAQWPFHRYVADQLEQPQEGKRRVSLPVGFVQQHHVTCAPATLAALCEFWSRPASHLEIAEEICYDGTPPHREREWCRKNGFHAREFTVTWDAAVALIDRGIPFSLTTIEPARGHLQAIIGYDSRRRTLLIRDPSFRHFTELLGDEGLQYYRSTGPRGMVMVPEDRIDLLSGLLLPDAELYDQLSVLQTATERHDRNEAQAVYEAMVAAAPQHLLTLTARRLLAYYDGDATAQMSCADALLEMFPDDAMSELAKLNSLRLLARREERVARLCALGDRVRGEPVFRQMLVEELQIDARQREFIRRTLRRIIRARPADPQGFLLLAVRHWEERKFDEALPLYRVAACLNLRDERMAHHYFQACRHLGRTDEGLAFLRSRVRQLGTASSLPAHTLVGALLDVHRVPEALATFDEALTLRPHDGNLKLYAATTLARVGQSARGAELLQSAVGQTRRIDWLRAAAQIAHGQGDLHQALAHWRDVVASDPLAVDAQNQVALLLELLEGRRAALAYLAERADQFPHHYGLRQLQFIWLKDSPHEPRERVLRQLIEIDPQDAWSHREMVAWLSSENRFDEALVELDLADELEPNSPFAANMRGFLALRMQGTAEARQHYRRAIQLSIENTFAIHELVRACDTQESRLEELRFVQAELERQVGFGDALLTFRNVAQGTYSPEELLGLLQRALEARPDLWHAWIAVVQQHLALRQLDQALDLAQRACEQFPLTPDVWSELATVHHARGDQAARVAALHRALEIKPSESNAARQLAMAHVDAGDVETARQVMERILQRDALCAENHALLAYLDWLRGERGAVLDTLEHTIRINPDYHWAWENLQQWGMAAGQPQRAIDLARTLTQERPGNSRTWLTLASLLRGGGPATSAERLAAIESAIACDPWNWDAYDLQAELLTIEGRFEEAEQACTPSTMHGRLPLSLRGRRAWILASAGDLHRAIDEMTDVLADDPNYQWGWLQILDWHRLEKNLPDYRAAAIRLTQIAPDLALGWGYLGDAQLQYGERIDAIASLSRALQISPEYQFAAQTLFDLYLAMHRYEDAEALLERTRPYSPEPAQHLLGHVRIALEKRDEEEARRRLAYLCQSPSDDRAWLARARTEFEQRGWGRLFRQTVEWSLKQAAPHPTLLSTWIEDAASQARWGACQRRLKDLAGNEAAWRATFATLLETAGQQRQAGLVRKLLRKNRDRIWHDNTLWADAGIALWRCGRFHDLNKWYTNWRGRKDLQPWMLQALAYSLRYTSTRASGAEINTLALELPPDHSTPIHRLWLATDALLVGDWQRARSLRIGIHAEGLGEFAQLMLRVVDAAIGVESGTSASPYGLSFAQAQALLRASLGDHGASLASDHVFRDFYRRYRRRAAYRLGGPLDWLITFISPLCYRPMTW